MSSQREKMAINIPDDVREELLRNKEEFGLSLSQMAGWLLRRHCIKITPQGLLYRLTQWEKESLLH
jgi:hypothetical protein